MNKLEVGMYVITTDRLEMGRITHFCECEMCKERGFDEPILDNPNMFITNWDKKNGFHGYKFYENLLDLIEVGDYVNGHLVEEIRKVPNEEIDRVIVTTTAEGWDGETLEIYKEEFKTIVTKEQFKSMEYRLGE